MPEKYESRDWNPPRDMQPIFEALARACASMDIDGDGPEQAMRHLIDAMEALAKHVAGDRGSHG